MNIFQKSSKFRTKILYKAKIQAMKLPALSEERIPPLNKNFNKLQKLLETLSKMNFPGESSERNHKRKF